MPTEAIGTVNNRNVVGMLKGALENGSITQDDYDELMQLFFPGPKLVQGDLFDEKAKGGMATMDYMTRPIHMNSGGDPELKGLLKALTIQLMLEKGMEGSTLMPSGNPDKIKRFEEKIRQIEIEIGE